LSRKGIACGQLSNGQLVRYRGMVQDMQNPEFFSAVMVDSPASEGGEPGVNVAVVAAWLC